MKKFIKDLLIRLAIAILKDRVRADLTKMGYSRKDGGMWHVDRTKDDIEAQIEGRQIVASLHEETAIRSLVDVALRQQYKTPPPRIFSEEEIEKGKKFWNPIQKKMGIIS
jgi:hypothetical protein